MIQTLNKSSNDTELDDFDKHVLDAIFEVLYNSNKWTSDLKDKVLEYMYNSMEAYATYNNEIEEFINKYDKQYWEYVKDSGERFSSSDFEEAQTSYCYELMNIVITDKVNNIFSLLEDAIESFEFYLDGLESKFWGNANKDDLLMNFKYGVQLSRSGLYGWQSHTYEKEVDSYYAYVFQDRNVDGLNAIDFRVLPGLFLSFAVDPTGGIHL